MKFVQQEEEPPEKAIVSLCMFNLLRPRENEGIVHVQTDIHWLLTCICDYC